MYSGNFSAGWQQQHPPHAPNSNQINNNEPNALIQPTYYAAPPYHGQHQHHQQVASPFPPSNMNTAGGTPSLSNNNDKQSIKKPPSQPQQKQQQRQQHSPYNKMYQNSSSSSTTSRIPPPPQPPPQFQTPPPPPPPSQQQKQPSYLNQQLLLSPLIPSTHEIMFDYRISEFSACILRSIELLLTWGDNTQDKVIGFRLIGCTCPYVEQASGKCMTGFIYRPTSISKFCEFLPVFYIHLRDDKCPLNVPNTTRGQLQKHLGQSYNTRLLGLKQLQTFMKQYFERMGIVEQAGRCMRVLDKDRIIDFLNNSLNKKVPLQSGISHTNTSIQESGNASIDSDIGNAVASAMKHKDKIQKTADASVAKTKPVNALLLDKNLLVSITPMRLSLLRKKSSSNLSLLLIKLLENLELYQPPPPKELVVQCKHSKVELPVHSLASTPYFLFHFYLYEHYNNCSDIPGIVVKELKQLKPLKYSLEYNKYIEELIKYWQFVIEEMDLKEENGGVYCCIGTPGSLVQDLESIAEDNKDDPILID